MANMVFYESWLETVNAFEKMMGIDFAKEAIYALVYLSIRVHKTHRILSSSPQSNQNSLLERLHKDEQP